MTATILEWGHSMTDDQWADFPASKNEFKIQLEQHGLRRLPLLGATPTCSCIIRLAWARSKGPSSTSAGLAGMARIATNS
eukprot:s10047_g4.t1